MNTLRISKVRMGMIGGGEGAFIGAVHRCAAALDGRIELVCGAFSRDENNNQKTGEQLSLDSSRVYNSWKSLLSGELDLPASERMEMLVIVTPNHLHVPIAKAALSGGFHVFSEKPAAISFTELSELEDVLLSSNRLYGLAHTYLGYPLVWQARQMIADGVLGNLRKIYVEYIQGWLSDDQAKAGNRQAVWRADPTIAGASGCIADIGTHAFSLAEFVAGQKITSICSELAIHIAGRQLDDDGMAMFHTDGQASGILIASQVCTGEENGLKIRLYGDKGGLEWQQVEPNKLIHRMPDEPVRNVQAGVGKSNISEHALQRMRLPAGHPEGYIEAMANLYRDFASAIRNGEHHHTAPGVPGIEVGLRGMAFVEASLNSQSQNAKWIDVADIG